MTKTERKRLKQSIYNHRYYMRNHDKLVESAERRFSRKYKNDSRFTYLHRHQSKLYYLKHKNSILKRQHAYYQKNKKNINEKLRQKYQVSR